MLKKKLTKTEKEFRDCLAEVIHNFDDEKLTEQKLMELKNKISCKIQKTSIPKKALLLPTVNKKKEQYNGKLLDLDETDIYADTFDELFFDEDIVFDHLVFTTKSKVDNKAKLIYKNYEEYKKKLENVIKDARKAITKADKVVLEIKADIKKDLKKKTKKSKTLL